MTIRPRFTIKTIFGCTIVVCLPLAMAAAGEPLGERQGRCLDRRVRGGAGTVGTGDGDESVLTESEA